MRKPVFPNNAVVFRAFGPAPAVRAEGNPVADSHHVGPTRLFDNHEVVLHAALAASKAGRVLAILDLARKPAE